MHSGPSGTPATPPLRSTLASPLAARRAMLDALRPTRIVGSDGDQHALDGLPVEDGDALVVATSGTIGPTEGRRPDARRRRGVGPGDVGAPGVDPSRHSWLACLPLAHIGGLSVVTRALVTGTPLVVMPGFDAEAVEAGRTLRVSPTWPS